MQSVSANAAVGSKLHVIHFWISLLKQPKFKLGAFANTSRMPDETYYMYISEKRVLA